MFLFICKMELGSKLRIFTIWQDLGKPGRMLTEGCVCVLGTVTHTLILYLPVVFLIPHDCELQMPPRNFQIEKRSMVVRIRAEC